MYHQSLREKGDVRQSEVTTGGCALVLLSIHMDVRRIEAVSETVRSSGQRTYKVVRIKLQPPFKEAEFDIMFGKGDFREADILELAARQCDSEARGHGLPTTMRKIGQGVKREEHI